MSSLFFGLEIAKRGLYASQAAMNVIGHNTANAETQGYTRQRVVLASIDPASAAARLAAPPGGSVGGGVAIQRIDQIRDHFLDKQYRQEHAETGRWQTLAEQMNYVESILNEMGDQGITGTLAAFFDSLSDLSVDPTSVELRTMVQQKGIILTETFNHYHRQLVTLQRTQNDNINVTVNRINDLTTAIAAHNKHIFTQELSGAKANDLRDKRNLMLDELSGLINIDYDENAQGMLQVSVDGMVLIDHIETARLEARPEGTGVVSGEPGFYTLHIQGLDGQSQPFTCSSGKLKAYLALRDDDSVDGLGIPRLLSNLDQLAAGLVHAFNESHTQGFTLPREGHPSRTGVLFFNGPADTVTAETFRLSDDILSSPYNIACSDALIDFAVANNQSGNNIIVLELVQLATNPDIEHIGSFTGFLKGLVVEVANKSAYSKTMLSGQLSVQNNLDTRRQSVSSVSVDEEMVNLVKMEHAYAAAARLINSIDAALEILINRTGLVGR